jgi:hypothetical protein
VSFETDLYAELSSDAPLVALVGNEIVPSHASQGVSAREFVVYTPIFNEAKYDLDGDTGAARVRLQVDCYSETQDGAAEIARAVIAAIPETGWPLHRTGHSNQDLGLESETRLFRRLVEFSIHHRS